MVALILSVIAAGVAGTLIHFRTKPTGFRVERYRPERHYMRGPGPKWREKHVEVRRNPR